MTIQRAINFGTRYGATLRWDVFNLFNTTNFGLPNRNISDAATLGTISSLSGDARIMQLAVQSEFLGNWGIRELGNWGILQFSNSHSQFSNFPNFPNWCVTRLPSQTALVDSRTCPFIASFFM